jgi:hypothetical protein
LRNVHAEHPLLSAGFSAQMSSTSTLGGNPTRLSASDANLLAGASVPIGLGSVHPALGRPLPPCHPNPITGNAYQPPPRSASSGSFGMGSKPMLFPARGTINSIGSTASLHSGASPSRRGARRAEKLEYELWCEAQRRSAAERELRNVQIRGRSRPPWVGDSAASGYNSLRPQTSAP